MRRVALEIQKQGINRLRTKGGASPETLYDLVNARLDTAGGIGPRAGFSKDASLPAATVGLFGFKGKLHTFASSPVAVPAGYQLNVLRHPIDPARAVAKIHYVHPLLGRLYVVAEFDDGSISHYWITNAPAWTAATRYSYKRQVQPVSANGYVYEVTNVVATPAWTQSETIVVNDERQPTVYSGLKMKAVAVAGAAPVRTSEAEPVWPTEEGGQVVEYTYGGSNSTVTPQLPSDGLPPYIDDEYGPYGYKYDSNKSQAIP